MCVYTQKNLVEPLARAYEKTVLLLYTDTNMLYTEKKKTAKYPHFFAVCD